MKYSINDTSSYHRDDMGTLGWELTVCNALEHPGSPVRSLLRSDTTYGNLLYDFLLTHADLSRYDRLLEIGGGYGYLMRDFLARNGRFRATMVDISGYLLSRQRETLKNFSVEYIHDDFFKLPDDMYSRYHCAILNENIGDFPTVINADEGILVSEEGVLDSLEREIKYFFDRYSFTVPSHAKSFHFNLGAVKAVEKLTRAGVPLIFISEHSCEASAPEGYAGTLGIIPSCGPEKISLHGHDEYTVKFSLLESVGEKNGYRSKRGQLIDIIPLAHEKSLDSILFSPIQSDRMEILRQFLYDLFKYEYILLQR